MGRWDCFGFVLFKFVTSLVEMYDSLNYTMQDFDFFHIVNFYKFFFTVFLSNVQYLYFFSHPHWNFWFSFQVI